MAEAEVVESENEEEIMQQDPLDPASFLMQPTWLLKSGSVKWYPEIDAQGGVEFVRLSKFDRHFVNSVFRGLWICLEVWGDRPTAHSLRICWL